MAKNKRGALKARKRSALSRRPIQARIESVLQLAESITKPFIGDGCPSHVLQSGWDKKIDFWQAQQVRKARQVILLAGQLHKAVSDEHAKAAASIGLEIGMLLPDLCADNAKKTSPENGDIRDLCSHLRTELHRFDSEIDCSRDFFGGNEQKAQNGLRQARRFAALWK